jgi:DNA adenine methylase
LNYVGGKFKLLPQIIPLFPDNINTFVDLFGGGFNVGINVNAKKIIYNDTISQVVDLFKNLQTHDSEEVHQIILDNITKYGLSRSDINSYEFYNCNSNDGLGSYNKDKYFKLRDDYNSNPTWDKFYTLVTCSFSNQIRFNSKGGFNMPYGKRDYNSSLQEKLKVFVDEIHSKDINFHCGDFRELKIDKLNSNDLVYCDPPYLNSTATYNENGGWTIEQENELRNLLIRLNNNKVKFALSNNLNVNITLQQWAEDNGFTIHDLNNTYSNCNYQKKDKSTKDLEVLITNY